MNCCPGHINTTSFCSEWRNEAFVRSLTACRVAGAVWICPGKGPRLKPFLSLAFFPDYPYARNKLVIISCHFLKPILLLHQEYRKPKLYITNSYSMYHHLCVSQVLDGYADLCFSSGDEFLLLVCYHGRRGPSDHLHLVLPTIMALTPLVRKPMWTFYQWLSDLCPLFILRPQSH